MSSTGFSVDHEALASTGTALAELRGQLANQSDDLGGYQAALGHPSLQGALRSFASNWSDARRDLLEQLESCAAFATQAAEAYRDTDTGIAAQIGSATSSAPARPTGGTTVQ